jgi:FHA domain-containing protein
VITLTVIAFNDAPADGTLQCHFDEMGGSIGRADSNQLVLPDPERMISRVAAQVVFRNGGFAIVDRGSNPIKLNGQALTSGREVPLAAGDVLHVGGYELRASVGASTSAANPAQPNDPFAGLLGPATPAPGPARGASMVDPLVHVGVPAVPARAITARATQAAPPQMAGIPKDWDPFAPHAASHEQPLGAAPPRRDALGLDVGSAAPASLFADENLPSATPSSLDQLFGLSGAQAGADPLASSVLDAPMAQPNMSADADPMRSLGTAPRATAASQADHLPDLQRAFIPPTTIKPPQPMAARPALAAAPALSPVTATARSLAPAPAPTPAPEPAPIPAPLPAQVQATAPAPVARPPAAARPEDAGALLEAFRRGLQAPAVDLPALTPELMELVGRLLHDAVGGTVELLRARSSIKHELRAQVTSIGAKSNNPLKFSPSAEAALAHLLAPPKHGFIAAAPAMRDAYDDLRAHQSAFVTGMRAVVDAALRRFEPSTLEAQLGDRSRLQNLLPASRGAKLWEQFVEHHARLRHDADDFYGVFGREFLKAYDEHVDGLRAQRGVGREGRRHV